MTPHPVAPNPGKLLGTLTAYQVPMAVKGALDLELFTHIAAGVNTSAELAGKTGASKKGVRVLCDFLTVHGFLQKSGEKYSLHPETGIFLDKNSPAYMGSVANFLTHETLRANFNDIAAVAHKGGATVHSTTAPDDPIWVEFARSMMPMMGMPAKMIAAHIAPPGSNKPMKVLDIAAGHGIFGIAVAQNNPGARIYGADWSAVLEVAKDNAKNMGVGDRYHAIPGSAFDTDLGRDYDVILLPNFLHHFSPEANIKLLKKLHAALKPDGVLATAEFVPNDDRVTPPFAAAFSMMMLGSTDEGDAYTYAELDRMFRAAGFGDSEMKDLAPAAQQLILTRK